MYKPESGKSAHDCIPDIREPHPRNISGYKSFISDLFRIKRPYGEKYPEFETEESQILSKMERLPEARW